MRKVRKRKKSVLLRLLVLGVSVYMIATLASLWNTYSENLSELESLKSQKAAQEASVEELTKLLQSGSKEQMIEKAARERLGYVYADEEIYIDISGN